MVPTSDAPMSETTDTAETVPRPIDTTGLTKKTPPTTQKAPPAGMLLIRKKLDEHQLSDSTKEVIMASWRQGTAKQYQSFLIRWEQYCVVNNVNTFCATISQGIEFLNSLFRQGLGYSAINTVRSALSSVINPVNGISFGEQPLVCRFLKGIFQLKPSLRKYCKIWDVSKVLAYLKTLPLTENLKLKELTQKLTMLIALLTGQRCQTIHKLDLTLMQKLPDKYVFAIGEKLKHTRPGKHQEPIELTRFTDRDLCVVEHIVYYI